MQDLWRFAVQTTLLGMGVVFVALFLLSVYMHVFKEFTGRIEGRRRTRPARRPAPEVQPAPPPEAPPPETDEGAPVAAAVAVALVLAGRGGAPGPEVAVAVATALALHRSRGVAATGAAVPGRLPAWRMAGRLEAMAGRLARQERARR